jgi:hypothetical protein
MIGMIEKKLLISLKIKRNSFSRVQTAYTNKQS